MVRTKTCTKEIQRGRLKKAEQFYEAAITIEELADEANEIGDAFVTLCVHAGIAAADAVCCAKLNEHAQGDGHNEATALLARADKSLTQSLRTLLSLKTDAGYSHLPASTADRKRAERAAATLVEAARRT